ncbi:hypothetical protein FZW96_08580 [Bacillus sp. BGMRC 2118]|nr:hypothetical protein FZW96_08580 [Bacillus sp. BGMRC 2118]
MEESKNLYQEGTYRFWLHTESGSLRLKLNGDKELYTIPKGTKLYDRLIVDLFSQPEKGD